MSTHPLNRRLFGSRLTLRRALGALGLILVLALTAALGLSGRNVPIKTGSVGPPDAFGNVGCYTSGTTGDLVTDPDTGVAIIEGYNHRRIAVTWPPGWTARTSGGEVEVLDKAGQVKARTGTHVNLMGGYWYVDGSFLTCGPIPAP